MGLAVFLFNVPKGHFNREAKSMTKCARFASVAKNCLTHRHRATYLPSPKRLARAQHYTVGGMRTSDEFVSETIA